MKMIHQKNVARVEVQKSFCKRCQLAIKAELQKIENIASVNLYPEHTMVVFSFFRANELAVALNTLSDLGYPEIGEMSNGNYHAKSKMCNC